MAKKAGSPSCRRRGAEPKLVAVAGKEKPEIEDTRQRVMDLIVRHAVGMVEATIEAAESGQYSAMKCLFELAGMFSFAVPEADQGSDVLARTLLEQLELAQGPAPESGVEKDAPPVAKR